FHDMRTPPIYESNRPTTEGFGFAWSRQNGSFFSGSKNGIFTYHEAVQGGWQARDIAVQAGGIESISCHYHKAGIIATGHTNKCVYIWDLNSSGPAIEVRETGRHTCAQIPGAHDGDVNVVRF